MLFLSLLLLILLSTSEGEQVGWHEVTITGRGVAAHEEHVVSEIEAPRSILNSAHRRERREIYGIDDRVQFNATTNQQFPFSTVVRLSTGCTGILVDEKYVLTAAHCVHDRYELKTHYLRVGYLDEKGKTVWDFARKIFYPSQWKASANNSAWADYDISVVKVRRKLAKLRGFIEPGISVENYHGKGDTIQFIGFPDDKPLTETWGARCTVLGTNPALFYFECDSVHGVSGSGIYTFEKSCSAKDTYTRRVVGVLSGNRYSPEYYRRYNVGVRLNPERYILICKWMRQEDECRKRYSGYFDSGITALDDDC